MPLLGLRQRVQTKWDTGVRNSKVGFEQNLLREHVRQAARLREYAASTTTARVKARLLEEAANQERLAEELKAGLGVTAPPRVGRTPWVPAILSQSDERKQRTWSSEAVVQAS